MAETASCQERGRETRLLHHLKRGSRRHRHHHHRYHRRKSHCCRRRLVWVLCVLCGCPEKLSGWKVDRVQNVQLDSLLAPDRNSLCSGWAGGWLKYLNDRSELRGSCNKYYAAYHNWHKHRSATIAGVVQFEHTQ